MERRLLDIALAVDQIARSCFVSALKTSGDSGAIIINMIPIINSFYNAQH